MFSTKLVASAFIVLASASGIAGVSTSAPDALKPQNIPIALDNNSLLVATLANGEIQTHWMPRTACEQVEAAVASGDAVAGIRPDGVSVYIAKANCSTRRIEVDPAAVTLSSASPIEQ
ncbi:MULTISPECIES: hypothetical protein [unclassified Hyphomicrobium]|uniref:hypothetical protein n=1 Tax=unclassified Hyphomicrobium TaxID=2619925 RepID=UPI0002F0DDDB|nr:MULTISPECIES: hypothetical protein [unclassified Hyphomicrobium]